MRGSEQILAKSVRENQIRLDAGKKQNRGRIMAHQFFFNPFILDNLPAPSTGFDVVQDLSEPRLRMYITSRGVKTFFVRHRSHGRDKRIIIGNYPDMDIEDARAAVADALVRADTPKNNKRRKIKFKKFIDVYMAARVRRGAASREKLVRSINRHLSGLFDKNIADITRDDCVAVIDGISGAAIRGRMQELLQSMFSYACDEGYVPINPIDDLPKVVQTRRVRPLNRTSFYRLVRAIKSVKSPNMRAAFFMLVYGFAPKSHIFAMQWRDLDFNHYTWCDRPLSDAAVVLLQNLPQNGRWVFAGRGRGHLTDPRRAWRAVANAAGVPNLTMDDVHKFLIRQLVWTSDREDLRTNMNNLLTELMV